MTASGQGDRPVGERPGDRPRRIGAYDILESIGQGGAGTVYRARDQLGRLVAVKIMRPGVDEAHRRLFEREARAIAHLSHPNVFHVLDVDEQDGTPFMVTELLGGRTLRETLAVTGPLPVRLAISYAVQMARGLAAIHATGVVHRDLKPDNVLITEYGSVKIADFALSHWVPDVFRTRLEQGSDITEVGAPAYAPPELLMNQGRVDARTDVFSLGAILYEMLSGRTPFADMVGTDLLNSTVAREPVPFSPNLAPPFVEHVVFRCLNKAPEMRFQSANDVVIALEVQNSAPERHLELLEDALDDADRRRYHAGKLVRVLDWSAEAMAAYLGCGVATVYRGGGRDDQAALGALAGLVLELERLFMFAAENDSRGFTTGRRMIAPEQRRHLAVAWMRTPSRALDDQAPEALILRGELPRVRDFVRSLDQAVAA